MSTQRQDRSRVVQLNVDDVDEVLRYLQERGVDVSNVEDDPWGRFCFFSDPDGC